MNVRTHMGSRNAVAGFSLIELMISLVLGLLVIAAAAGIYLSNRETYRATDNLGVVQENIRTAFELMARDIREAAGNPCVNNLPISNVVNNAASRWYTNLNAWNTAIEGFGPTAAFPGTTFGTAAGTRLSGTEAIQLFSGDDTVATVSGHDAASGQFTLNTTSSGFATGDLMMVCNSRQAAVFQASAASGSSVTLGTSGSPGNCSVNLGLIGEGQACSARDPFPFSAPNSVMVKLNAARWYIANNANGRPSLYQSRLVGGNAAPQEVAEGVSNLSVRYLVRGDTQYRSASDVAGRWADVISAHIDLTVVSPDRVGTNNAALQRHLVHVVSLRNRNR